MKRILLLFTFIILTLGTSFAQILDPVKWQSKVVAEEDKYYLVFTATMDKGWAVYSQYLESDDGPIRTSVNFDSTDGFELLNASVETGNKKEGHDALFDMNVIKFFDTYTIKQEIKITNPSSIATGYVEYMTCDDSRCLPPTEYNFELDLNAAKSVKKKGELEEGENSSGSTSEASDHHTSDHLAQEVNGDKEIKPLSFQTDGTEKGRPVQWIVSSKDNTLVLRAEIMEGWKIYSQDQPSEDTPIIPLTIKVNEEIMEFSEVSETRKVAHDHIFDVELASIFQNAEYHYDLAKLPEKFDLKVEFMSCDATSCIFPDPLDIHINTSTGSVIENKVEIESLAEVTEKDALYPIPIPNLNAIEDNCEISTKVEDVSQKGWMTIFLLGLIGGILALLTPCVFPMIPLTVSFFTKSHEKSQKKGVMQAYMYGAFIFLIYVLLSVPFHLLDSVNPGILNNISTNVILNLVFFAVFLFFAFSFFGFYELTLPSAWVNKSSSAESVGGIFGVFFMALTLALVSFSCTGPILGTLLAGSLSSQGGAWQLTAGMAGFGAALAIPFGLFAAAPKLMAKLPKSGGWLNTIKVVLGFLELALAFKFLSNADMVKQWGLLKIEPFLIIWILCALGTALYLFGIIRFPHDSPNRKIGPGNIVVGTLFALAAIYMLSGFRYNENYKTFQPLSLLSGLAPPVGYSWIHPSDCPQNLDCFHDLESGLEVAKEKDKPIFLDFSGYACVNCRKMEEHVWSTSQVKRYLEDEYEVISLYVDDREPLDSTLTVKNLKGEGYTKLRTQGSFWEYFQTLYFNNNSQPLYVLLSPDGEVLSAPVGYTPDANEFAAFLACGLESYKNKGGGEIIFSENSNY